MLLAGRCREAAVKFAKSLGMIKALLSQIETRVEFHQRADGDVVSPGSPMINHSSHQPGPISLLTKQKRRLFNADDNQRKVVTQVHKTMPLANAMAQEETFMTFHELFLLQSTESDGEFSVLKCHSACIIFNMAVLHHVIGSPSAITKAEQLYRLAIEVNKGFVMSLTDPSSQCIDGTSMMVMLASLNNLSQLLCQRLDGIAEATSHMNFLSRLLHISRDEMLCYGVVSEYQWSGLVLNALLVDHRIYQVAAAA